MGQSVGGNPLDRRRHDAGYDVAAMCECGHTAYWHGQADGAPAASGSCEGNATYCACDGFVLDNPHPKIKDALCHPTAESLRADDARGQINALRAAGDALALDVGAPPELEARLIHLANWRRARDRA